MKETELLTDRAQFREAFVTGDAFNGFPENWLREFRTRTEEEQESWYNLRFKCLYDATCLSGFVEEDTEAGETKYVPIMGMDFQANPHKILFEQFVQKKPGKGLALSDLDNLYKKRMILWSRGLFKTSAVVVDIVQTILNYPNARICFLTGGDKLAKRQLQRIKRVFEKPTDLFMDLFPDFCLTTVKTKKVVSYDKDENPVYGTVDIQPKMGTAHDFIVPARTNYTFAEPTFAISTSRSVKAGSHYDKIYIDDLVNETNYKSVKALEKCYQDYIDICPLLEPTGYIIMTGTRYSYGDTYERIQETAQQEERERGRTIWKFSIRDCWSMGCKNCEHTDVYHNKEINILQPPCGISGCKCIGFEPNGSKGVLFPEKKTHDGRTIGHTLDFLEGERLRLGEEFFANQYENSPIAAGTQTFNETLIGGQTLHNMIQIPPYNASFTFVVGDLAYIGQEGRDYSVLYVCRVFQGQIFVFDCVFGNWDSGQVADQTVNLLLRHRPNMMYYERFLGWEAYDRIIQAAASVRGVQKVPLQWEQNPNSLHAKTVRIGTIKGVLASKRLWLFAQMPGYQQLVQQLVKWPKLGRHDDFADALGQVIKAPTGYQLSNPPAAVTTLHWLGGLHRAKDMDDDYTDQGAGTGINCG
jgi:hypothetical protein